MWKSNIHDIVITNVLPTHKDLKVYKQAGDMPPQELQII